MLQSKVVQIVMGVFKATSISALNIEVYIIPMHHILDKLVRKFALQISETFLYDLLLDTRNKKMNRHLTLLKTITRQYEASLWSSVNTLEKKLV